MALTPVLFQPDTLLYWNALVKYTASYERRVEVILGSSTTLATIFSCEQLLRLYFLR